MARKKAKIDYLQFLNAPIQEGKEWFFSYMNPEDEQIVRETSNSKFDITRKYLIVKRTLLNLQKSEKPKIKTKIKVKERKKYAFNEGSKMIADSNKLMTREFLTKALELKIDGYDDNDIALELVRVYKLSEGTAKNCVKWVYGELSKDVDENQIRTIVLKHGLFYDKIYKKLIELDAPKIAMKALRCKENLNNIGSEVFEIQINNIYEEEQGELVSYGLDNLTSEEQKELFSILKKMDIANEAKRLQLTA